MRILAILQVEPFSDILARLGDLVRGADQGALNVVFAVAVVVLGWGVAALVSRILRGLLRVLKFNEGVRGLAGESGVRHEPAGIVGWATYWLLIAVSAMLALEVLGIHVAAPVADRLNDVVPRIVTSAVLLAVGSGIAVLIGGITRRFLQSAGMRGAQLQGRVVSVILTGFAALLALEQLGFAAQFVMILGISAVSAAGLGLALAFGLGCRDLARDFVVEYLRSLEEEKPRRPD